MRALLLLASAAACATHANPTPSPSPTPGAVYPTDTTRFDMTVSGGLQPAPAAGSTCTPGSGDSYSFIVASRALSWTTCSDPANNQVFMPVTGQATLATSDNNTLVAALTALEPAIQTCGSDVTLVFTFTTPESVKTYPDAICLVGEGDVESAVYTAAH